jgi:hypothetical protein
MKKKPTQKTKKPTDLKPRPPVKKAAKPSGNTQDEIRSAVQKIRKIGMGVLMFKMHADLVDNDAVTLPRDLVDHILDIIAAIEADMIRSGGLEDEFIEA